jgi:hypothetical protein
MIHKAYGERFSKSKKKRSGSLHTNRSRSRLFFPSSSDLIQFANEFHHLATTFWTKFDINEVEVSITKVYYINAVPATAFIFIHSETIQIKHKIHGVI